MRKLKLEKTVTCLSHGHSGTSWSGARVTMLVCSPLFSFSHAILGYSTPQSPDRRNSQNLSYRRSLSLQTGLLNRILYTEASHHGRPGHSAAGRSFKLCKRRGQILAADGRDATVDEDAQEMHLSLPESPLFWLQGIRSPFLIFANLH